MNVGCNFLRPRLCTNLLVHILTKLDILMDAWALTDEAVSVNAFEPRTIANFDVSPHQTGDTNDIGVKYIHWFLSGCWSPRIKQKQRFDLQQNKL
jgi:hypothetical protein